MPSYVEHANISVTDVDAAIAFFRTAMPDWEIRHDSAAGAGNQSERWVHLGTAQTYIAINQMPAPAQGRFAPHHPGFNHVGFVVDDVDALRERMVAAGYQEGYVPPPHPWHQRVYFIDPDGIEYEFAPYRSDDPGERNDYTAGV